MAKLNVTEVIKRPLITEQLANLAEVTNLVAFQVDRRANKIQIKQAVEQLERARS